MQTSQSLQYDSSHRPNSYHQIMEEAIKQALALNASPKDSTGSVSSTDSVNFKETANPKTARKIAGLIQIHGPTGIGKSSTLYRPSHDHTSPPLLTTLKAHKLPAILITHRWNILHDIYLNIVQSDDAESSESSESSEYPLTASIIYSKEETFRAALLKQPLPHENTALQPTLPDPYTALNALQEAGIFSQELEAHSPYLTFAHLLRRLDHLTQLWEGINQHEEMMRRTKQRRPSLIYEAELKAAIDASGRLEKSLLEIAQFLDREVIKSAHKLQRSPHSLAHQQLHNRATQKRESFRQNPWIRRIFPAIAWKDEAQNLLILTTHKAFYGFYDGEAVRRLTENAFQGHVIFIDEFDYQASILQTLLAKPQIIREPMEFLGQIVDGAQRLLPQMYSSDHPEVIKVADKLADIQANILTKAAECGIDFERPRAFVVSPEERKMGQAFDQQYLHRSDHLLTDNSPLYTRQTEYGLEVSHQFRASDGAPLSQILNLFEETIKSLSFLINNPKIEEMVELKEIPKELLQPQHDHNPSYYSNVLTQHTAYIPPGNSLPELLALMNSNLLPDTNFYLRGLVNWQLEAKPTLLTPNAIAIKRAAMLSTPESVLVSLASRNLLFALSATSYAPRAISHFNLPWVNRALRYLNEARNPDKMVSFLGNHFDTCAECQSRESCTHCQLCQECQRCEERKKCEHCRTCSRCRVQTHCEKRADFWYSHPRPLYETPESFETQKRVIEEISATKKRARSSTISALSYPFASALEQEEYQEMVNHLGQEFFLNTPHENIGQATLRFRQSRLVKLLHTFELVAQSPDIGHLVFATTLGQLRRWLTDEQAELSRRSFATVQHDEQFTLPKKGENSGKESTLSPLAPFIARGRDQSFFPLRLSGQSVVAILLTAATQRQPNFMKAYFAAFKTFEKVIIFTQIATASNGINLDFICPTTGRSRDLTSLYLLEPRHHFISLSKPAELSTLFEEATTAQEVESSSIQQSVLLYQLESLRRQGHFSETTLRRGIRAVMQQDYSGIQQINAHYKTTEDYLFNMIADIQQIVGRTERSWEKTPNLTLYLDAQTESAGGNQPTSFATLLQQFKESPPFHRNESLISEANLALIYQLEHEQNPATSIDWGSLFTETPEPPSFEESPLQIIREIVDLNLQEMLNKSRHAPAAEAAKAQKIWNELGRAILRADLLWQPEPELIPLNHGIKKPLKQWAYHQRATPIDEHSEEFGLYYHQQFDQFYEAPQKGARYYNPHQFYEVVQKHPAIKRWFASRNYRTSLMPPQNLVEQQWIIHPEMAQRILQGRIGEEALRALLFDYGISTRGGSLDARSFELYDFYIPESPFRIDAKYWSPTTQEAHELAPNSRDEIRQRLQTLREIEGDEVRLIIANLQSKTHTTGLKGFTADFKECPYEAAAIVMLPGALSKTDAGRFRTTSAFYNLITLLSD